MSAAKRVRSSGSGSGSGGGGGGVAPQEYDACFVKRDEHVDVPEEPEEYCVHIGVIRARIASLAGVDRVPVAGDAAGGPVVGDGDPAPSMYVEVRVKYTPVFTRAWVRRVRFPVLPNGSLDKIYQRYGVESPGDDPCDSMVLALFNGVDAWASKRRLDLELLGKLTEGVREKLCVGLLGILCASDNRGAELLLRAVLAGAEDGEYWQGYDDIATRLCNIWGYCARGVLEYDRYFCLGLIDRASRRLRSFCPFEDVLSWARLSFVRRIGHLLVRGVLVCLSEGCDPRPCCGSTVVCFALNGPQVGALDSVLKREVPFFDHDRYDVPSEMSSEIFEKLLKSARKHYS